MCSRGNDDEFSLNKTSNIFSIKSFFKLLEHKPETIYNIKEKNHLGHGLNDPVLEQRKRYLKKNLDFDGLGLKTNKIGHRNTISYKKTRPKYNDDRVFYLNRRNTTGEYKKNSELQVNNLDVFSGSNFSNHYLEKKNDFKGLLNPPHNNKSNFEYTLELDSLYLSRRNKKSIKKNGLLNNIDLSKNNDVFLIREPNDFIPNNNPYFIEDTLRSNNSDKKRSEDIPNSFGKRGRKLSTDKHQNKFVRKLSVLLGKFKIKNE
ncbi:hypothetical protein AYI69_g5471 [Smittium culicis]|uniref:Uncharacterized protein n=1 Tax=Smittium culicis TaxID=133412 RepID=A0A1R1Y658_9FUNG|nr:hypothetical protein AYI69_g5471 [Smittium culicis]